jgi:hypothetical protein
MTNLIAYTYAKSIDLSSERGSGDRGGGFSGSGDERNRAGSSRALSGFDVRNRLVVSSVFELPFGKDRRASRTPRPSSTSWWADGKSVSSSPRRVAFRIPPPCPAT